MKSEITADKSSELQAVKRLATYLLKPSDRCVLHPRAYIARPEVLATLKKQQEDNISFKNPIVANMAATIYMHENVPSPLCRSD